MMWAVLVPLLADCGSISDVAHGDGGGGKGGAMGAAGSAGSAAGGGRSGHGGGAAGTSGGTGVAGAVAGGTSGSSGPGAAGTGGGGSGGAGIGGRGGTSAVAGAAGSGTAGRGGIGGGAGTGGGAVGSGGVAGAASGGRGGIGAGAGTGGGAVGGGGTAGAAIGGRGGTSGSAGAAGAATGGRGGAPIGGTGGSGACLTPPAGALCGCGARVDCNGVCAPVGTCAALAFDGTDGSVSAGATTALSMGQSATIEAWVRVRTYVTDAPIFRKLRGNTEDKTLALQDGYVRMYFYRGGTTYIEIRSRARVPLDNWTHIAGVYDGNNIRIYMNGVRTDTAPVDGVKAISNADGEIFIGRVQTIYDVTFDGVISDLRVSSTARYTTETFVPPALLGLDSVTLALWRLDEGAGISIADIGPAHLNASITRASATGPPRWVSAPARY